MCTRTVSAIAHVLEAAGLTTLTIGTVEPHIRKVAPPRGLICHFPLGRPLGKPADPSFQHLVLENLFALLAYDHGPVLETFAERLDDTAEEVLVCTLPPRLNNEEHPAVDEARSLKSAYQRAVDQYGNHIGPSREISASEVPTAIEAFVKVASGTPMREAGIPGVPMRVAQDIRGYYQTAALALAEHTAGAWASEDWFYQQTETGKLMLDVRKSLKDAGAPRGAWFFLSPGDR